MKAIDYYNRFGKPIMDEILYRPKTHLAVQSFLDAFTDESIAIMSARKPSNDRAVIAVFKQQNRKWNDLCHLIEQHYGFTPLKRNAYFNIMKNKIPGLAQAEATK